MVRYLLFLTSLLVCVVLLAACATDPATQGTVPEAPFAPYTDTQPTQTELLPRMAAIDTGAWQSRTFQAQATGGNYVRVWYDNKAEDRAVVTLHRTDPSGDRTVVRMTVEGGSQRTVTYHAYDTNNGTYYLLVEAAEPSCAVDGNTTAVQYDKDPDRRALGA